MPENKEGWELIEDISNRVSRLEEKSELQDKRFDKVDDNLQRIWEQIGHQRDGQIKTQTLVEVVSRDVSDLKVKMDKNTESQQSILQKLHEQGQKQSGKWESFWKSNFTQVLGYILTILGTLLIAKYVHF